MIWHPVTWHVLSNLDHDALYLVDHSPQAKAIESLVVLQGSRIEFLYKSGYFQGMRITPIMR